MNQQILSYLRNYNKEVIPTNRLIVSAYLYINKINVTKNKILKSLLIPKDNTEEYSYLKEFINLIKLTSEDFNTERLLELFEFVVSPSDKVVNGAVYTPRDIREYITEQCFSNYEKDITNAKIVDIACGCGGFLIDAVNILKNKTKKNYKEIFCENIFGIDIQEYSIERTKIILSLLAIKNGEDEEEFEFNLYTGNSLEFDWKCENRIIEQNKGFDIILGNPPYVCSRNMDDKTKELMKNLEVCSTGHPDLYIPFFEIGYKLLNKDGVLGYITVNSFIKSVNGRAIRKYFREKQIELKIINFGHEQIFNSRMTYTCLCFISKKLSETMEYIDLKRNDLKDNFKYEKHKYIDIDKDIGWYIKNRTFVNKIEKTGIPFGKIYNTKSGIATLKNSVYIFKPLKDVEDENYFYISEDIKIEKAICKKIINSNLLVKNTKIDEMIEILIFPYYYDNNMAKIIEEDNLKNNYPCAYEYLEKNRDILEQRDKGKGKAYKNWYSFGRNQSLEKAKYKLFFPQLARDGFFSYLSKDEDLYFYNGMAAVSNNKKELEILQQILKSDIFWKYVSSVSKPYASNYLSLGRNYLKKIGIIEFTEKEKEYLISLNNKSDIDKFLNNIYKI